MTLITYAAPAADWIVVAKDRIRSVELDRSSIIDSDSGTRVAWGRIVISEDQLNTIGYKTLRVLNRFDCTNRSFTTVKRVYLSADSRSLKEEPVENSKPNAIRPGTADEQFYNVVCPAPPQAKARKTEKEAKGKTPNLQELGRIVQEANRRAEQSQKGTSKSPFRLAGLQLAKEEQSAEPIKPVIKPIKPVRPPSSAASEPESQAAKKPAVASEIEKLIQSNYLQSSQARHPTRRTQTTKQAQAKPSDHSAQAPTPAAASRWSYEGETGPAFWGKLRPDYGQCASGTRQSPIDLRDGIKVEQEAIVFDYKPSYFRIQDNGHTIQVSYGAGSRLSVMGRNFELIEFHFHHPSEERFEGRSFDMSLHLVHKDLDGRIAVLAIMLERGVAHPLIQTVWNNLPLEKNEDYLARTAINASDIIPEKRDYYSYMGSLTTPPCTEGILWLVMKQPVQVSEEQIAIFSRFYRNNARPIQATHDRVIKESR